jgi:hypothetical protein
LLLFGHSHRLARLWQQFTVNLQHNRHKGYRLSTPVRLEKHAEQGDEP